MGNCQCSRQAIQRFTARLGRVSPLHIEVVDRDEPGDPIRNDSPVVTAESYWSI